MAADAVADDGADEKVCPPGGSAVVVTRGTCCLVGGSFHLLRLPKLGAKVNLTASDGGESGPCLTSGSLKLEDSQTWCWLGTRRLTARGTPLLGCPSLQLGD